MRDAGAANSTLTNKQSYIGGKGGFFEWAMASGYYPVGDNPAAGHVSYSSREKRARRKFGFKPYDAHQVQALFEPAAFETLPPNARWAALIGLYTGARASEVGQLLTVDIFEEDGVPCLRISDEGEHQKVKTDVSLRTIPIHPDLLALGFLDWVDHLARPVTSGYFRRPKPMRRTGKATGSPRRLAGTSLPWASIGRRESAAFTRFAKRSSRVFRARGWFPSYGLSSSAMNWMTSITLLTVVRSLCEKSWMESEAYRLGYLRSHSVSS
jgi:integrase